jgi:hypothetical protein
MSREGLGVRTIATRLCVDREAVRYWLTKQAEELPQPIRKKTKSGSGVIAPPVYPGGRGYRWGSGL